MNKKVIIVAVALITMASSAYLLGWSDLVTVRSVEITGTQADLPMPIKVGERLARIETRAIAADFEKNDFVRSARVTRNGLTGKVSIAITPRLPIARYGNRGIDETGAIFKVQGELSSDLVQINANDDLKAIAAANFALQLPSWLERGLRSITVSNGENYVLQLHENNRNIEITWGSSTDNQLKASVYKALIALPENSKVKKIDLSAPHAPIVK